jgi:IMP dehydrogenase
MGTIRLDIPIIAANMDTVMGPEMAEVMGRYGSVPILHRFYKNQEDLLNLAHSLEPRQLYFMSCGVVGVKDILNTIKSEKLRPYGICVDIAHGHSVSVMDTIKAIKDSDPSLDVIAGNVCTGQGVHDLANAGADGVKVGIGPGAVCTTRKVTGFGVPQFTAVEDCAIAGKERRVPIIADGGIRSSRDCVLALAAGASSVMIGGLLAKTLEAAGGGFYRGQASESFQTEFYGGVKEGTVPEGVTSHYAAGELRPASKVLDELLGGIRSGLTYGGASSIKELQRKAKFMRVTANY